MLVWYFLAAAALVGLFVTASRSESSFRILASWGILLAVSAVAIMFHFAIDYVQNRGLTDHYTAVMTVEQAREAKCPIPLPPEARNVQFGVVETKDSTKNYVRFEAPVAVCRAHMKTVIKTAEGLSPELIPLKGSPEPLEAPLRSTGWYDIEKIVHGETASFENILGRVWIDTDRGIFYFQQEK